jgi:hypothetical protein
MLLHLGASLRLATVLWPKTSEVSPPEWKRIALVIVNVLAEVHFAIVATALETIGTDRVSSLSLGIGQLVQVLQREKSFGEIFPSLVSPEDQRWRLTIIAISINAKYVRYMTQVPDSCHPENSHALIYLLEEFVRLLVDLEPLIIAIVSSSSPPDLRLLYESRLDRDILYSRSDSFAFATLLIYTLRCPAVQWNNDHVRELYDLFVKLHESRSKDEVSVANSGCPTNLFPLLGTRLVNPQVELREGIPPPCEI